ncbi:MAG TPA: DUF3667 domain-containing protein [Thermoanaerobaculia bacterium]|nr:DUF3667 domain-containing protein [Thermoanaerobaculia bacterium]
MTDGNGAELDPAPKACTNCGAVPVGVYCSRCGERQPGHHDLSVKHFGAEVLDELAHIDSKLFRTLRRLVFRPGMLPREYFAGRKSRLIAPLRLFLALFALQFFAFSYYQPAARYSISTLKHFDSRGALTRLLAKGAKRHQLSSEEYESRIDERWHKNLSLLELANILGLALVLKVLYWRRYFTEHIVFSAYILSFAYILALASWPIYATFGFHPGPLQKSVTGVTIAILLVYLFLAQRRFYGVGRGVALFKTALLWFGNFVVTVVILTGSLLAALLHYR